MKSKKKKNQIRVRYQDLVRLLVAIGVLALIPVTLFLLQQRTRLTSDASDQNPELFFVPSTLLFTETQQVKLMLDTKGKPIVFADVRLAYDSGFIKIRKSPIPSSLFGRLIDITHPTVANGQNGGMITVGVNPNQAVVNGVVEIASFPLGVHVTALKGCSELKIDANQTRVVGADGVPYAVNVLPAISCSPATSPSPAP